jgi:hypothetical protein
MINAFFIVMPETVATNKENISYATSCRQIKHDNVDLNEFIQTMIITGMLNLF